VKSSAVYRNYRALLSKRAYAAAVAVLQGDASVRHQDLVGFDRDVEPRRFTRNWEE
jgi:hypothetical protein